MRKILFGLIGGILIGVACWVFYARSGSLRLKATTIIQEISSLNRLETAHMITEGIIENNTNTGNIVHDLLFGDKLILVAHGEVVAGIDFSQLQSDAVTIKNGEYFIVLPPSRILITSIDNAKTRVYDRQTGILTKGDVQLESQARENAEKSLRNLACKSSILAIANENASRQIRALLGSFGVSKLHIQTQESSCE